MNKLLIVTLFAGMFLSCNKYRSQCNIQPYYTLTPSAKQWFPYSGTRALAFVDISLNEDTLHLKDFFVGDDEVWNGDECRSSSGQFLRGNIIDLKSNDTIKIEIGYTESVSIERKKTWIYYNDTKNLLSQPNMYRRFETSLTLNGRNYMNVLINECSPTDNCVPSGITKYYFAKNKGLVGFERGGRIWTLKE